MRNKKIIGVTGGIASGKSEVCKILASLGGYVIDCDRLAHDVIRKGNPAYDEIIRRIGGSYLDGDGEIIRKRLGEIVFNDADALKTLEEITHRYIAIEKDERVVKYNEDPRCGFIVLEAVKIIESGLYKTVDELWAVTADAEKRIQRAASRDGAGYKAAKDRINAQMSDAEIKKYADKVIENENDLESLKKQVTYYAKGMAAIGHEED